MKRFALSAVLVLTTMICVAAQSALQPLVVVKLNGHETITVKDLKNRVDTYQQQANQTFDISQKKEILNSMVDQKLIVQAARKAGVTITDSQVDQYFLQSMSQYVGRQVTEKELVDLVRQQMKMSLDELMQKQVGMTLVEYKATLKEQLLAQQYILSRKQSEMQGVSASDKEIRDFYELNKASFVQNDMMRMFLVIIPKGTDEVAAKTKAEKTLNEFKTGKLTLDQMRNQSKNPENAAYSAGDVLISKTELNARQLGIPYDRLLKIFAEELNTASDIKETEKDFQFYTILEKYPAKMLLLSDVVQPGTTFTVYDYIKQNLTQTKQSQFLQEAILDISKELNVATNVEWKKSGADLDKLLNW